MFKKNYLRALTLGLLIPCAAASYSYADGKSDLTIPVKSITQNASFIPVEADGTKMEIIAVRDSNGEIRTAFNTCQVCNGSELAYYKQSGNQLVCQNCGNRFSMDRVGISAGSCNPYPILENERTITDDEVIIPETLLKKAKDIFASWKVEY